MPGRALIIGIEHYPQAVDLAQTITDATTGAQRFFDWVTGTKGIAPGNIYVCVEGATFAGANVFSTERERIIDAIAALVAAGQDQTDELFVFYSGHGYGFEESLQKRAVDVLVAGDFESADKSGTKCINLQEVQEKLWAVLGGQNHYYFVDGCRTLIRPDEIDPIGLGRTLGRAAQRGRPTKYTLYSTAYGTAAAINSAFGPALLDGLHGTGHSKGFNGGRLYVIFPLLCSYIQSRVVDQKLDQNQDGSGDGFIVEIVPIPKYTCTIEVEGAAPADAFTAKIAAADDPTLANTQTFTGPSFSIPFRPGNLVLEVMEAGTSLERVDPTPDKPLDFWDSCRTRFRRSAAPAGAVAPTVQPLPSRSVTLAFSTLPGLVAEATNLRTGVVHSIDPNASASVPAGDYAVTITEDSKPISRTVMTLAPGTKRDLGVQPLDPIRSSIVQAVGGNPATGVVDFSESLGPMANRDLGLWLTLMGASHIVDDPTTFSKLGNLPLADIRALPSGSSGVYILAATGDVIPTVGTIDGPTEPARPVPPLHGVFQYLAQTRPGPQLVTICIGSAEPLTLASFCLPNRLTFLVFSPGSRGRIRVNQFILPMFHLSSALAPEVDSHLRSLPPLPTIRTAYFFQAEFGRKVAIAPTGGDQAAWDDLLYGKWLDPVMSLLACYEIIRRGGDDRKSLLVSTVIPNLEKYFPGLPDTAAIAESLGQQRTMPAASPLFREGLLAFPDWEHHLALPPDRLDFNHIWTAWRGTPAAT